MHRVGFKEIEAAATKRLNDVNASADDRKMAEQEIQDIQIAINNDLTKNLILTERQLVANNKIVLSMKNVRDIVDDLGNQIRNPAVAANKFLGIIGGWAPALLKSKEEGKSFFGILKGMGEASVKGLGKAFSFIFSPTGWLIAGIGLVGAAFTGLFKLFTNYWDFLDKKVIPATAEFNKQIGGLKTETAGLQGQMQSAGVEMEMLGYSFEEGASLVRDLSKGLSTRPHDSSCRPKAR